MKTVTGKTMTKAQARVAIARDVIKHLKARKVKAKHLTYCVIPGLKDEPRGRPLHEILRKPRRKPCEACAMGAMFLAHVTRFNQVKTGDASKSFYARDREFDNDRFIENTLPFTQVQLRKIEAAFEGIWINETDELGNQPLVTGKLRDFRKGVRRGALLEKIMRNIVKNKGTFEP